MNSQFIFHRAASLQRASTHGTVSAINTTKKINPNIAPIRQ
jgi:hypothetical protein